EREEKQIAEEREEKRNAEEREAKRILEEKELENAFQLKKLQLEFENKSRPSETVPMAKPKLEMSHLLQKFDPKEGYISLYLVLFERQARRVEINEDSWVSHLIGLLPYEMSQLIARESEEVSNDYSHIKKLMLKRYKFWAEKFSQKFNNHIKSSDSNWTDFLYELRNYFEEWLKGLEVKNFAELSDLIVTEQIKRRVPWEVKEHFIDEWADIKSPEVLAKRLDEYDSVRSLWKKKSYSGNSKERFPTWKAKSPIESKALPVKREEHGVKKSTTNTEDFEKRRTLGVINAGLRNILDQIVPC
ncbi:hypothetical protein AVEN_200059-1, partial [Araneus ventricosus]